MNAPEADHGLLWHATWFFAPRSNSRPNRSGNITDSNSIRISKSKLPSIIDLNPSDETCIPATLLFVIGEARNSIFSPLALLLINHFGKRQ